MKLKDYIPELRNSIADYCARLRCDGYSEFRIFIFRIECYIAAFKGYIKGYMNGLVTSFMKGCLSELKNWQA